MVTQYDNMAKIDMGLVSLNEDLLLASDYIEKWRIQL